MHNLHHHKDMHGGNLEGLSNLGVKIGTGSSMAIIFIIQLWEGVHIWNAVIITTITSTIGFFVTIFWKLMYDRYIKKWLNIT